MEFGQYTWCPDFVHVGIVLGKIKTKKKNLSEMRQNNKWKK